MQYKPKDKKTQNTFVNKTIRKLSFHITTIYLQVWEFLRNPNPTFQSALIFRTSSVMEIPPISIHSSPDKTLIRIVN